MQPATKKILPMAIVLAIVVGVFVGLRVGRSSRSGDEASNGTNSSAVSTDTSRTVSRVPIPHSVSNQTPAERGVASSAPAQKPETPFVLGSPETPPQMDPATVVGNMRI